MHLKQSQAYKLSPDQYLRRFKTPHAIISPKGNSDVNEKDMLTLEEILEKSFDDNQSSGEKKEMVVNELNKIVRKWLQENSQKPLSCNYGLKIFGSYSLKANSYDGDIDMICIVPDNFSRQKHFFGHLVQVLKSNSNISQLFPIPDAHVPIIKFLFYDVQIDLLFCRLPLNETEHEIDYLNDIHLMPISEKQLKSLNGYRTSIYLKNKLPKYKNFQTALKALKMWARNKGVYSQIYGYLGGAGFSIMLAKICQLYPNYSVLQLLDRFFFIYANWVWTVPIMLEEMPYQQMENEMTIYTPFEPYINAAHDISKITSFITKKQLKAGSKLIQDINKGKKQWKNLFQPINFFQQYRYFLQISVMGDTKEDFIPWKGNIESKMRKLIRSFEQQQDFPQGIQINPYPRSFPCKHQNYSLCVKYYMGLKVSPSAQITENSEIDLSPSIKQFLSLLQTTYPNIEKTPKLINVGFCCVGQEGIAPQILQSLKLYQ